MQWIYIISTHLKRFPDLELTRLMGSDTPCSHNFTSTETQRIVNLRAKDEPNVSCHQETMFIGIDIENSASMPCARSTAHTQNIDSGWQTRWEKPSEKDHHKCRDSLTSKNNTTLCFAFQLHRICVERKSRPSAHYQEPKICSTHGTPATFHGSSLLELVDGSSDHLSQFLSAQQLCTRR